MKKITTFFIALLLAISTTASAQAVGDKFQVDRLYYEITNLETPEVKVVPPNPGGWGDITKPTGDLTIPVSVTYNSKEYAVTEIGGYAFHYCGELTSVTIPNSVITIGENAFFSCSGLTTFTIPKSVNTIVNVPFTYCSSLTAINVEEGNAVYSSQDGVLFNLEKTMIIRYPEGKTATNYTIPSSVTTIGSWSLAGCLATTITIPQSVTTIESGAFSTCKGLASLEIPNSVTTIGNYAFQSCDALSAIIIPNGVTSIGSSSFSNCISLTSIDIPNSVNTIGEYAFDGCSSLTAINCQIAEPASITSFGDDVFRGVPTTTCTLYVPVGSKEKYRATAQWNAFTNIAEKDFESGTVVGDRFEVDGLFYEITNLETPEVKVVAPNGRNWDNFTKPTGEIVIPASVTHNSKEYTVTSIGNYAFQQCTELTSATIPNSVKTIENYAFAFCYKLTSVNIPDSVIEIGGSAFYICESLSSIITIPVSVKTIGRGAFWHCSSMPAIHVETGNTVYSSQDGILFNYDKTILITYPGGKEGASYTVPSTVNAIEARAFSDCKLTTLTIPESVTSINDYALYRAYSLTDIIVESANRLYSSQDGVLFDFDKTTIIQYPIGRAATSYTIPNSVTTIGDRAFEVCKYLTSMTIPESVTTIGSQAFDFCRNITSITIPNSVTTIKSGAFRQCYGLTTINCHIADPADITTFGSRVFSGVPTSTCTLYVPIGSREKYAAAEQWKEFTNIVEGEEPNYVINDGVLVSWENATGDIVIPDNVHTIGYECFLSNDNITSVTMGDNVLRIERRAFGWAGNLSQVTLSSKLQYIGGSAFSTTKITSISIPETVTYLGDEIFFQCRQLQEINVAPTNQHYKSIDGVLFNINGTELIQYPEGKRDKDYSTPQGVIKILDRAFSNFYLERLIVSEGVMEINGEIYFYSLKSLSLPSTLTKIEGAIRSSLLETIELAPGNTHFTLKDGVLYTSDFLRLIKAPVKNGMTNYVIPEGTSTIESSAFKYCTSLKAITIPSTVTEIGWFAFEGCNALDTIIVKASTPPNANLVFGDDFQYDKAILFVPIGSKEKYANAAQWQDFTNIVEKFAPELKLGDRFKVGELYYEITNISPLEVKVVAPNADGWGNTGNPSGVAAYVINRRNTTKPTGDVVIPKTVAYGDKEYTVTAIDSYAFSDCNELTSITIPGTVSSIGDYAFNGCTGLTAINCQIEDPNTITTFGQNVFQGVSTTSCTLYVPTGSTDEFANAEQWSEFFNIEEKDFGTVLKSLAEHDIHVLGGKGVIKIQTNFDQVQSTSVSVYNISGALVRSIVLSDEQAVLPINAGTYIVRIGNATEKIIVQ